MIHGSISFLRRPFFTKLFNWEYWSFNAVYIWIYPVWLFLCLRARSFFFFSAANPSIKNGGFLCESKKDINAIIPESLYPPTLYFNACTDGQKVIEDLKANDFHYPLIGKPNIGGRGRGVKILRTQAEALQYTEHAIVDYHIQQFIAYPQEVGIFYYRFPNESAGKISGVVRKEFLTVIGDGKHSIRQLLQFSQRAVLQLKDLQSMYGDGLNEVLKNGEEKILVPYGNHARGAKFVDESAQADEKLTAVIDHVCRQVKDFYFGRLDIRYNSWEELKQGKHFCIIEVNGAGSEPTHIYDPRHSLFFAWREIIRHWIILWKISRINHKKGSPYLSIAEGVAMFREDKKHSRRLAAMPV